MTNTTLKTDKSKIVPRVARVSEPDLPECDPDARWSVRLVQLELTQYFCIDIRFSTRAKKAAQLRIENSRRADFDHVWRELMSRNARLPNDKKTAIAFVQRLMQEVPSRAVIAKSSPGFSAKGAGFVMPKRIYGNAAGRFVWDSHNAAPGFGSITGNLRAYSAGVLEPALHSPYLTLAVLTALGSSLLGYVESLKGRKLLMETAIFHFAGESSSGKTTLGLVVNSVFGAPDVEVDYDASDRGIAEQAYRRNNLALVIDDTENLGHDDAEVCTTMQKFAQAIPRGRSKLISGRAAKADLSAMRWTCFGISTGPLTYGKLIEKLSRKRHGDRVRLFDMQLPDAASGGIFGSSVTASRKTVRDSAAMIAKIERTIELHHGVLFDAWMPHLLDHDFADQIEKLIEHFVEVVAGGESALEKRVAKKFGVFYAAGVIGIEAGLLPWPKDWPMRALRHCHINSREVRDPDGVEVKRTIRRLARAIDAPDRFPRHKKIAGSRPRWTEDQIGVRFVENGKVSTWLAKDRLLRISHGFVSEEVFDKLIELKLLAADPKLGGSRQIRVRTESGDEKKVRLWRLNVSKLREMFLATRKSSSPMARTKPRASSFAASSTVTTPKAGTTSSKRSA